MTDSLTDDREEAWRWVQALTQGGYVEEEGKFLEWRSVFDLNPDTYPEEGKFLAVIDGLLEKNWNIRRRTWDYSKALGVRRDDAPQLFLVLSRENAALGEQEAALRAALNDVMLEGGNHQETVSQTFARSALDRSALNLGPMDDWLETWRRMVDLHPNAYPKEGKFLAIIDGLVAENLSIRGRAEVYAGRAAESPDINSGTESFFALCRENADLRDQYAALRAELKALVLEGRKHQEWVSHAIAGAALNRSVVDRNVASEWLSHSRLT